jgi:hypothetical protein
MNTDTDDPAERETPPGEESERRRMSELKATGGLADKVQSKSASPSNSGRRSS